MPETLAEYLGNDAVAAELVRCGSERGWTPSVPARPWRRRGFTEASVALVDVAGPGGARRTVVKIAPPAQEPGRHASPYEAVAAECPPAFRPHLVLESEPGWVTPDGWRLTFQELAGDDVHGARTLDALPRALLCAALEAVPAALLLDWNCGVLAPRRTTVAAAVTETLGGLLSARGSVRRWAGGRGLAPERAPWIAYGDGTVCPNPLLLADPEAPGGAHPIDVLAGRGHRDLHTGNVLVPEAPAGRPDPARFQLIDLDTYRPDESLTTDPVYLLLSAVAGALPDLPAHDWDDAAAAVLARTGAPPLDLAVAALGGAEAAVRAASPTLLGDWRLQRLVSTAAVALAFTDFSGLGEQRRAWCFRLAARAGRAVLEELGEPIPDDGAPVETLLGSPATAATEEPVPAVDRVLGRIWRAHRDEADAAALFQEAYREAVALAAPERILAVLRGVHADAVRRLGPQAPITLALLHALGYWSFEAGDRPEARRLLDAAWRQRRDALGPGHPDTLESRAAAAHPRLYRDGG